MPFVPPPLEQSLPTIERLLARCFALTTVYDNPSHPHMYIEKTATGILTLTFSPSLSLDAGRLRLITLQARVRPGSRTWSLMLPNRSLMNFMVSFTKSTKIKWVGQAFRPSAHTGTRSMACSIDDEYHNTSSPGDWPSFGRLFDIHHLLQG